MEATPQVVFRAVNDTILERVQYELEAGRGWRAKELLRGRMAAGPFDPDLHGVYGEVLLATEEVFEAGKHLVLAGSTSEDHSEAIQLFLQRMSRTEPAQVYALFPRRARLSRLAEYPETTREYLRTLKFPEEIPRGWLPGNGSRSSAGRRRSVLASLTQAKLLLAFVLLVATAGMVQIVRWLLALGQGLLQ